MIFLKMIVSISIIIFIIPMSCVNDNKDDYFDTSNVDYGKRRIKLLAKEFVGNPYLKLHEIKISINIPINQKIEIEDTLQIKKYLDSVFFDLKIHERSTIQYSVFNETNYTNKVVEEKKGLLFCDFSPCVMNYGFIYDPVVSSVLK